MVNEKSSQASENKQKPKVDLTWEAYNDIRRMIFLRDLRPGHKIPYRGMAKRLGMSLTPVVQALKHLEFLGLVRHEPNRGFYVQMINVEEIREVYELREVLEMRLIQKVIVRLNDERLERIRAALEEYLTASKNGSNKLRLAKDIQFHLAIAAASGEPITTQVIRYLLDFLYLRFEPEFIFSRPQETAEKEHQAIYNAIAERDVKEARKAIGHHIRSIRDNALKGIKSRLVEEEEIEI